MLQDRVGPVQAGHRLQLRLHRPQLHPHVARALRTQPRYELQDVRRALPSRIHQPREHPRHHEGSTLQGDHSGCVEPPVDFITKVLFYYEAHVLKRNLCFEVNRRFVTT